MPLLAVAAPGWVVASAGTAAVPQGAHFAQPGWRLESRANLDVRGNPMHEVRVNDALWASSIFPEGILERWFIADGAIVKRGDRVAEIRIERALHEVTAPASGSLTILAAANSVVEPGSLLAELVVTERS